MWDAALLAAALSVGRFPDPKLIEAAKLLRPEERPVRAQVVSLDDVPEYRDSTSTKVRQGLKKQVGGFALAREREDPYQPVYVNRDAPDFNDSRLLAAVLAHEATHTRRKDDDEVEPYQVQHDVLKRLNYNPDHMNKMLERIALLKQMRKPE